MRVIAVDLDAEFLLLVVCVLIWKVMLWEWAAEVIKVKIFLQYDELYWLVITTIISLYDIIIDSNTV